MPDDFTCQWRDPGRERVRLVKTILIHFYFLNNEKKSRFHINFISDRRLIKSSGSGRTFFYELYIEKELQKT